MDQKTYRKTSDKLYERLQMIDQLYDDYAKTQGITYAGMTILDTIYECQKECTQKLICELTHYPKQTVNIIVKNFLEQGYIEMKEMPSDRRNKYIVFTSKGREYAKKILNPLENADMKALETLGQEQYEILIDLVNKYESALRVNLKL